MGTDALRRAMYVSSSDQDMRDETLAEIALTSLRNNKALNLTGMLVHIDGAFMQVLEGPAKSVTRTLDRIEKDARHRGIIHLINNEISGLAFADWKFSAAHMPSAALEGAFVVADGPESFFASADQSKAHEVALLVDTFFSIQRQPVGLKHAM